MIDWKRGTNNKNKKKETKELELTFQNNKYSQSSFGKIPAHELQVNQNTTFSFFASSTSGLK